VGTLALLQKSAEFGAKSFDMPLEFAKIQGFYTLERREYAYEKLYG
jgi:hypothetical protein